MLISLYQIVRSHWTNNLQFKLHAQMQFFGKKSLLLIIFFFCVLSIHDPLLLKFCLEFVKLINFKFLEIAKLKDSSVLAGPLKIIFSGGTLSFKASHSSNGETTSALAPNSCNDFKTPGRGFVL